MTAGKAIGKAVALVAAGGCLALAAQATANAGKPREFDARRVELSRFTGRVEVSEGTGCCVRVLAGDAAAVLSLRGETLSVDDPAVLLGARPGSAAQGSNQRSVVRGTIVNIAGPGQVAVQNIGGSEAGMARPLLRLAVPAGTQLVIRGFDGDAQVALPVGAADYSVNAGSLQLARVQDGRLAVSGAGDIEVARVAGDLKVRVDGAGSIGLAQGRLASLDASVRGAGDLQAPRVAVGQLDASVDGAGEMRIGSVATLRSAHRKGAGALIVDGKELDE